jgi:uncharacterized protein (TIGR04141 family)
MGNHRHQHQLLIVRLTPTEEDTVMATSRLTFYLMREGVDEFEAALASGKTSSAVQLADSSGIDGRFYRVQPAPKSPGWVSYVRPILAEALDDMRASSASGLLLVRSSGRIFALTFGYGRSLLDLSKIEYQFGLKVALNRIDPRRLRSIDTKTFEDMVVTTNTQVSKSAEIPTFRVDVATDILRAVTGEPRDKTFAKGLSGADSLVMNVDTLAADLPGLCDDLLQAFGEDTYKSDFAWIDHLALVRDADLVERLDEQLVADLATGSPAATHLAVPESISWEDIDAFRIAGTRQHEYDDLDIDDYLGRLGDRQPKITLKNLTGRRVSVRFARSENFDARWTLYKCLVSEQRLEGALHVLIEGQWFAISESLVEDTDKYVSSLPTSKTTLIPAEPGEHEKDYNARLAKTAPQVLLNLDAKIKCPGGAASGIEICDVLSDQGEFIHVKRKARSATLSHLFAQGHVSAFTFLNDGHFRDEIRALIKREAPDDQDRWFKLIPSGEETVDRSHQYRVTFAVVTNSQRDGNDWLPFFSKLNLMHHGQQLRNWSFEVALVRVPIS